MWSLGNGSRQVVVAFLAFLATSVGLGVVVFVQALEPEAWTPLGPYPIQQIVSSQPVSLSGGSVDVIGKKCADDDTPVRGVVIWTSVSPATVLIPDREGAAVAASTDPDFLDEFAEAGGTVSIDPETGRRCLSRLYTNEIPAAVAAQSRRWLADGKRVAWIITGTETPTDGNREGVPLVWSSEPFEVIE